MSIHFHSLTIKRLVKETPDCVSVCFEVPESLKTIFSFREGQNLTIKKKIGEEEVRRSYSICNAPHEGALTVAIKKLKVVCFLLLPMTACKPAIPSR
jgi:ring-1,2-phenylacetyl-CoA epoxidase subunit PaaE